VDLKHMLQEPGNNVVAMGIDLTEFYLRHQNLTTTEFEDNLEGNGTFPRQKITPQTGFRENLASEQKGDGDSCSPKLGFFYSFGDFQ
jgi:hypothetical protein